MILFEINEEQWISVHQNLHYVRHGVKIKRSILAIVSKHSSEAVNFFETNVKSFVTHSHFLFKCAPLRCDLVWRRTDFDTVSNVSDDELSGNRGELHI